MTKLYNDFISCGQFQPSINHTQIVLIPKKVKPVVMGDFRPISLCNVLY